jgi:hypothetical protein
MKRFLRIKNIVVDSINEICLIGLVALIAYGGITGNYLLMLQSSLSIMIVEIISISKNTAESLKVLKSLNGEKN